MSMTLVAAKVYVSRVFGGAGSQEVLDMAGEAIIRAYTDWQAQKFWRFLLKDTTSTTAVAACNCVAAGAVVTAPSTGAFDFVNIGQTVTISAGTATLAAATTVLSFTRNTDGTVAILTLSANFGGTTNASATLTFSGNIPVTIGTNDYNLPLDFAHFGTARLASNQKRTLVWREQAYWDRTIADQTVQGTPLEYTTYNPVSEATQNYGTKRLKFDRIPQSADTLQLLYYRKFNVSATSIDVPDDYLYTFLDYATSLALDRKRAMDDPAAYRSEILDAFQQKQQDDEGRADESDADNCIKTQYEMGEQQRPLWTNGDFDLTRW
jgi:hypothetical protein